MEGVGSRPGRASSRYASGPSAPPFNGPVRKWKKQWVSSKPSKKNIGGNNRNDAPPLLLCRWTPISAADSDDEPRKRRFRYAPIVPIEISRTEALEKVSTEAGTMMRNHSNSGANMTSDSEGMIERKPSNGDLSTVETPTPESEDQADSSRKSLLHGSYSWEKQRGKKKSD